jgi:hypothetical protein
MSQNRTRYHACNDPLRVRLSLTGFGEAPPTYSDLPGRYFCGSQVLEASEQQSAKSSKAPDDDLTKRASVLAADFEKARKASPREFEKIRPIWRWSFTSVGLGSLQEQSMGCSVARSRLHETPGTPGGHSGIDAPHLPSRATPSPGQHRHQKTQASSREAASDHGFPAPPLASYFFI